MNNQTPANPDSRRFSLFSALNGLFERACSSAERESQRIFGSPPTTARRRTPQSAKERSRVIARRKRVHRHTAYQSARMADSPTTAWAAKRADEPDLYQIAESKRLKVGSVHSRAPWLQMEDSDATLSPIVISDDDSDGEGGMMSGAAVQVEASGTKRNRESTLVEPEHMSQLSPPRMDLELLEEPFPEHGRDVLESLALPPPPAPPPPPRLATPKLETQFMMEHRRESLVAKQTQTSTAVSEHGSARSSRSSSRLAGKPIYDSAVVEQARLEKVERELRRLKKIIAALLPNGLNEEDLQSVYGGFEQPERTSDDIISRLVSARFGGGAAQRPRRTSPLMQRQSSFPSSLLPPSPKSSDSPKTDRRAQMSPLGTVRAVEQSDSGNCSMDSGKHRLGVLSRSSSVSSIGSQRRDSSSVRWRARQQVFRKPSAVRLGPSAQLDDQFQAPLKDPTLMAKLLEEMKTHKLRSVEKPKDMLSRRYRRV